MKPTVRSLCLSGHVVDCYQEILSWISGSVVVFSLMEKYFTVIKDYVVMCFLVIYIFGQKIIN